jgi:hypothetical protein
VAKREITSDRLISSGQAIADLPPNLTQINIGLFLPLEGNLPERDGKKPIKKIRNLGGKSLHTPDFLFLKPPWRDF